MSDIICLPDTVDDPIPRVLPYWVHRRTERKHYLGDFIPEPEPGASDIEVPSEMKIQPVTHLGPPRLAAKATGTGALVLGGIVAVAAAAYGFYRLSSIR